MSPAGADGKSTDAGLLSDEIPLSAPWLGEREEEFVLEALRSGQLSLGPMADRFEQALAERVGARYVAAVSSGTAGLHLAVRLAGVGPGDEVVTTPFSFVASANCVLYEGATPVFADIDPEIFCLSPTSIRQRITPRTKAIIVVDLFGHPAAMDEILASRLRLFACGGRVRARYKPGVHDASLGTQTVTAFGSTLIVNDLTFIRSPPSTS